MVNFGIVWPWAQGPPGLGKMVKEGFSFSQSEAFPGGRGEGQGTDEKAVPWALQPSPLPFPGPLELLQTALR